MQFNADLCMLGLMQLNTTSFISFRVIQGCSLFHASCVNLTAKLARQTNIIFVESDNIDEDGVWREDRSMWGNVMVCAIPLLSRDKAWKRISRIPRKPQLSSCLWNPTQSPPLQHSHHRSSSFSSQLCFWENMVQHNGFKAWMCGAEHFPAGRDLKSCTQGKIKSCSFSSPSKFVTTLKMGIKSLSWNLQSALPRNFFVCQFPRGGAI